jgi:hypothetical protein
MTQNVWKVKLRETRVVTTVEEKTYTIRGASIDKTNAIWAAKVQAHVDAPPKVIEVISAELVEEEAPVQVKE